LALLAHPVLQQPVKQVPAKQEPVKQETKQQPIINGDVNITNNNTTTINGDVYINKPKGFER
jgi:hypothetical protein